MKFEKGKVYKLNGEKFKKELGMTDEEFELAKEQWVNNVIDVEFEIDRDYIEEENYELETGEFLNYTIRPDWCEEVKKESIVKEEK